MITEVKGNLISMAKNGEVDGLAHGCNCFHAMGSGIAGQLAREFPEIPEVDATTTEYGDLTKIGKFSSLTVQSTINSAEDYIFDVYNCYTQKAPSYDGSDVFAYDEFPVLLQRLHEFCEHIVVSDLVDAPYRLGFPQIGAGLAGGDWNRIRQMIVDEFETSSMVNAVLVEYQP